MKTPEDFRRDDVREVFKRRLGEQIIQLRPLSIKIEENLLSDKTMVDLSFERLTGTKKKKFSFKKAPGSGFVDAVFVSCRSAFAEEFTSLNNLILVDLQVKPIFSMSITDAKTDAKTDVVFRLETKQHGISEFRSRSRSIVYSSFAAILGAFQFYMNCDKTFSKLQYILEDARRRNRGDVSQGCISDLSVLTRVNTYA